MNERDLFRAIGDVDDDLVTGIQKSSARRPLRVYLSGALAACLCVALLFVALRFLPTSDTAARTNGQYSEQMDPVDGQHFSMAGVEHTPEVSTGNTATATDVGPAGIQSSTQPAEGTVLHSEVPDDFCFTITWGDHFFDSKTGIFTENGSLTYTLTLTEQDMVFTWRALSALSELESDPEGDIVLTFTANDLTRELRFSQEPPSHASLICDDLIAIIEYAADRLR